MQHHPRPPLPRPTSTVHRRGSGSPSPPSSVFPVWCTLWLTSVHHPSKVSFFLFSFLALSLPFSALELLLLLSGQCPNPGPVTHPCPVCHLPYDARGAYQCSLCKAWTHYRCSGLPDSSAWHSNWQCPACSPVPPAPAPPPALSTLLQPYTPDRGVAPSLHESRSRGPNAPLFTSERGSHCIV